LWLAKHLITFAPRSEPSRFPSNMVSALMARGVAALFAAMSAEPCWAGVPTHNKNLRWQPPVGSRRSVAVTDVSDRFRRIAIARTASTRQRLGELEAQFAASYAALPKNENGLLSHQAFNYVVQRYFSQEFGLHIRGIGADQDDPELLVDMVSDVNMLHRSVPALMEAMLEEWEAHLGLSLGDLAKMVLALHEFILDDLHLMLLFAYSVNGLSSSDSISLENFSEVTTSTHVFLRDGFDGRGGDGLDLAVHQARRAQREKSSVFIDAHMYMMDMVSNFLYSTKDRANPFRETKLPFDMVSRMFRDGLQGRGKVQNYDCLAMKDYMVTLDPLGSGRVPLQIFYDQPDKHVFRFSEPLDYLNNIGALDMSNPSQPGVVISNYVLGPASCLRSASMFSYCCISECDVLMQEIERGAGGPYATPDFLLAKVSNFSTDTVEESHTVPAALQEKLREVGERHGGRVPLHGRLFAQWLHFVFPSECPYPQVKQAPTPDVDFQVAYAGSPIERTLAAWTNEEDLPLVDSGRTGGRSTARTVAHVVFSSLAVLAMLRSLLGSVHSLRDGLRRVWPGQERNLKLPSLRD